MICQSGTTLSEWAREPNPEEKTRNLAKLLGCQSDDAHEILGEIEQKIILYFKIWLKIYFSFFEKIRQCAENLCSTFQNIIEIGLGPWISDAIQIGDGSG